MNLLSILQQLKYLRSTAAARYGDGLGGVACHVYYSLLRVNTFHIYLASLASLEEKIFDLRGVTFISPSIDELDKLRSEGRHPRELFADQFCKAHQCLVAVVEGEIAYIHWIFRRGDHSRFLDCADDSAEINYVLTLPKFRGRGISAAALHHSLQSLGKQGVVNAYAVIHSQNIASAKSFVRAGFVKYGKIVSVGPFNRKRSV